jgi:hypothetical protein
MRSHGDPDQADPTVDANKVIHITMSPSVPGGLTGPNGQSGAGPVPGSYCQTYLLDAIDELLQGSQPYVPPSQAALVKYAECMRANGVPDFPDPTAGGLVLHSAPGSNPTLQNAAMVCVKKTGVQPALGGGGPPPPGTIEDNGGLLVPVSGGNGGPGAND